MKTTETKTGTAELFCDDYSPDPDLLLMNEVCKQLRAIPLGATRAMPFGHDQVRRAIARHMGYNARVLYHLSKAQDGSAVVERSNRLAVPPMGRRAADGVTAASKEMAAIKPGDTAILYGHDRADMRKAAAGLKRSIGAAFRITHSTSQPDAAKVTRVDGILVADGYGNTVDMGSIAERTPYPFRTMKPGDRFTATADAHGGIESMRVICSKFSKRIGYNFRAAPNPDGSVTVTCAYRQDVWVSEQRFNEVIRKLKSQQPQVISEIWE